MLLMAALLIFATGCAHSYLGERYILMRLFKRDGLPKLFGGTEFTAGTLRFAWHITTLAWFGFAALLVLLPESTPVLLTVSIVSALSGLCAAYFTKGKHLSWLVFFVVSALTLLSMIQAGF